MVWGSVELEPEVQRWLEGLPSTQFATAAAYIDLLTERGVLLGEPYTRQLLTVFYKTRMREVREIDRAGRALARCIAEEHIVEED